jgi:predicted AAA+ superfamily ATPase
MVKSRKPKSKRKADAKPADARQPDAATLLRIADALERLAPKADAPTDFDAADAFIWQPQGLRLAPVPRVNRVEMMLLKGIDRVRDTLMENERSTAINPGETVEEKVSLSDRFGLWLGFHRCSQDEYLAMVDGYVGHFKIPVNADDLRREALEWATTRGSRSGRVAWQFVQDLAGRKSVKLS